MRVYSEKCISEIISDLRDILHSSPDISYKLDDSLYALEQDFAFLEDILVDCNISDDIIEEIKLVYRL